MTRLEANRKIIQILEKLVEGLPDWRFQQILFNTGLYEPGQDRFYEESIKTLNNLEQDLQSNDVISKTLKKIIEGNNP
jgi:flagellar biosynthesis/type III secretory pathway ATPase